jgi:hypothetical protein
MALDAQQVNDLQNSQPPTDWSKFDNSLMTRGPGLSGPGPGDDRLHVRFYTKPTINVPESTRQNRPVYQDTPYIEMMMPGEKNVIIREPVWEQHKQRFPQHWAQFQLGEKDQVIGTPLKVVPFLTESQIEELAHFKIRTVEQLAEMADSSLNFMGAQELKQAAKRFLDKSRSGEALMARIEALEAENARLARQAQDVATKPQSYAHPKK